MRKDLIKQLKEARKLLLKAVKLYPENPSGEWSRKKLLSHIAGWDEEFDREVGAIPKILTGGKPTSFKYKVDNWNRISIRKRKGNSEAEILEEMNRRHSQFIKLIKSLNENQLKGFYGTKLRGKDINVLWIINEVISHDNGHAKEIEEKYGNIT